jgi:hypothetical protein
MESKPFWTPYEHGPMPSIPVKRRRGRLVHSPPPKVSNVLMIRFLRPYRLQVLVLETY